MLGGPVYGRGPVGSGQAGYTANQGWWLEVNRKNRVPDGSRILEIGPSFLERVVTPRTTGGGAPGTSRTSVIFAAAGRESPGTLTTARRGLRGRESGGGVCGGKEGR